MVQALWFLSGLGLGLALDFLLVKVMLRSIQERLSDLEKARESELLFRLAKAKAKGSRLEKVQEIELG
jgi:hypothetical protein